MLVTRGYFMLIWRIATGVRNNITIFQYFMYPDRKYAEFSDPAQLNNFFKVIGELARISAFKLNIARPAAEQVSIAVTSGPAATGEGRKGGSLLENRGSNANTRGSANTTKTARKKNAGYCSEAASEATLSESEIEIELPQCKEMWSYAETVSELVALSGVDLEYHLTPKQLKNLRDFQKPPKDPEGYYR